MSKELPRVPRIVSQLRYPLPDGTIDPASNTDCGETCVSSVVATRRQALFAPGCLRQTLGKPTSSGVTTSADIEWLFESLGVASTVRTSENTQLLRSKVEAGNWAVVLGYWAGLKELHWVVWYGVRRLRGWYMDPWYGEYRSQSWRAAAQLMQGTCVYVADPLPRKG